MKCCWAIVFVLLYASNANAQVLVVENGSVAFFSKAPKELIEARSADLKGVLDATKGSFYFKVGIASFQGFNSPLQRQHFNENYMESETHPHATYNGKLIEGLDLSKDGTYSIRTKGKFTVHGVAVERIVPATITVKDGKMALRSEFNVPLVDHRIKIPRVVYEKLAPEIAVTVAATLVPRS